MAIPATPWGEGVNTAARAIRDCCSLTELGVKVGHEDPPQATGLVSNRVHAGLLRTSQPPAAQPGCGCKGLVEHSLIEWNWWGGKRGSCPQRGCWLKPQEERGAPRAAGPSSAECGEHSSFSRTQPRPLCHAVPGGWHEDFLLPLKASPQALSFLHTQPTTQPMPSLRGWVASQASPPHQAPS